MQLCVTGHKWAQEVAYPSFILTTLIIISVISVKRDLLLHLYKGKRDLLTLLTTLIIISVISVEEPTTIKFEAQVLQKKEARSGTPEKEKEARSGTPENTCAKPASNP